MATILRPKGDHTEALFIRRATDERDPWSGHMAFPGGHRDLSDRSLQHTAERETLEEIGLDLARHATFLGELDPVRANSRIDMVVTPFLYELRVTDIKLNPNHEVAAVLWSSLNNMMNGQSFSTERFQIQGRRQAFPGYRVDGIEGNQPLVWGLTYRMLQQFFSVLDPDWQPHD